MRPLPDAERERAGAGLRASDAFARRRCRIVLAGARGEPAPAIARRLGCGDRTAGSALPASNARGPAALRPGPRRAETNRRA